MISETIFIQKYRPNGFGFSVNEKDGEILVTQVTTDSAAYNSGLRSGDIIYTLNKEVIQSAQDFIKKLGASSDEVQLGVKRVDIDGRSLRTNINYSAGSGLINRDSSKQLSVSTKSINESVTNSHILDSNYVPEEHIDNYLQPMTPDECLDKGLGDSRDQVLITRKQAYKKTTNDNVGLSEAPRISVKKATKATSFYIKDPNYTIKKKINYKMNDVATALSNINQRPRPSTVPITNTHTEISSPNTSTNQINALVSDDSIDAPTSVMSPQVASSPTNPLRSSDPGKASLEILNKSGLMHLEVDLKMLSFKEKIKKPVWKKFSIEKNTLGVLFTSLDLNEAPMASNSTAIDPYISGLGFYMQLWHLSNTISRFFLPIGHEDYDDAIEIWGTVDSINVKYLQYEVEFLINISRIVDNKTTTTLYNIFELDLPDTKQSQIKPKRPHGSMDNLKPEPTRKQRTLKYSQESPRDSLLSTLSQSRLVENVPLVVVICIGIIERLGIRNEGIYRKSGNEGSKKRLESLVVTESCDKWSEYEEWSSINTVGSLLKSVLRGYSLIDRDTAIKLSMINVTSVDESNQEQVYMDMIYHLRQHLCKTEMRTDQGVKDRPPQEIRCRLDTFKYLIKHLYRVCQYLEWNKMSADNLATCFSPTIIEDIPCDDNGEYQTSKKSEADKNLKQMVTFWITNSNFICDLLDEDDELQRFNKLLSFVKDGYEMKANVIQESLDVIEEDAGAVVRKIIENYTSQAFVPSVESFSVSNDSGISTTDGNVFVKPQKNVFYQSFKLPKKDASTRRTSSTTSPQETRKASQPNILMESTVKTFNPMTQKKIDNWASKSVRVRKKDPMIPLRKEMSLTSMRLSGLRKNVPLVVDACITIINNFGLNVDGIYRISGKKNNIDTLDGLLINNKYSSWLEETYIVMWANIHTVSCFLKSILKQLCLIKKETWVHMSSQFSEKMEHDDVRKVLMAAAYHLRHEKRKAKIDFMARDYYDRIEKESADDIRSTTLRYVLQHLKTVSHHVAHNRMTSLSLAVCFMPVLMEEDDSGDIMAINNKGIQIIEKLIDHCDWIFQWDDRPWGDVYGLVMRDSLEEYLRTYSVTQNNDSDSIMCDVLVDSDDIRPLLTELIDRSHSLAHSRSTLRRHSDSTDSAARKTDYRESKVFDDSQLPDRIMTDISTNDGSGVFQLTDSLL